MAFRSNGPVIVALPPFRGVTRRIVLTAIVVYLFSLVLGMFAPQVSNLLNGLFSLQPVMGMHTLVWQVATYPFISISVFGILFSALSVWFFGASLESELGSRWMTEFFFVTTIVGGLVAAVITLLLGHRVPGLDPDQFASGLWPFAMGLLLAFARLHADQELNFNFILRVKAKYVAAIYLLLYLAVALSSSQRFDALVVLTNSLVGWLYARYAPRRGLFFGFGEGVYGVRNTWVRARRRRAAKKFAVYMQKQGREVHFDQSGRYVDPDGTRRNPDDRKWMN